MIFKSYNFNQLGIVIVGEPFEKFVCENGIVVETTMPLTNQVVTNVICEVRKIHAYPCHGVVLTLLEKR